MKGELIQGKRKGDFFPERVVSLSRKMSDESPFLYSSPKVLVSSTAVNSFSYNMEYEG